MATFYTGVDKSIYQGGDHYVPMEQFRLGPYNQKNLSYESESQPQSYGITNTNAFTNSGNSFNPSGNAFGYGSALEPGGSYGSYGTPNYTGGLSGNVQQYGVGRQFEDPSASPTGETYSYKKEVPGWARIAAGFVPFGNTALNFMENRMNANRDQPSGRYAIGGLNTMQKGMYDNLAGAGLLFEGPAGVKTLTGKNFGAKGYFEGQAEFAEKFGFAGMTDEEIEEDIANTKGFKKKQKIEAWNVFKTTQAQKNYAAKQRQEIAEIQNRINKEEIDINKATEQGISINENEGIGSVNPSVDKSYSGGNPNPHTQTGWSGSEKSSSSKGKGRDPDDRMATGGRVGLNYGGLASMLGREDFKKGGRIGFFQGALADTKEGKAMSPGTTAGGDFRGAAGEGDTGNTVVVPKTNYIDIEPELVRKDPYIDLSLMDPLNIAKLKATIGYRNILDNDDLSVEGDLTTNIGPVDTNTQFTEDGIGNTTLNLGNFSAEIDPTKTIQNIGYNNSWNGINYGVNYADGNTMFNVGTTFKNGGLASIL